MCITRTRIRQRQTAGFDPARGEDRYAIRAEDAVGKIARRCQIPLKIRSAGVAVVSIPSKPEIVLFRSLRSYQPPSGATIEYLPKSFREHSKKER
jgi:hypothetical protein